MVIQRWQTVFLFISTVLVVIFTLVPFAEINAGGLVAQFKPTHFVGWLTLNIVIALMTFIAIFLYRNIRFQKKVTKISMVMMVVSVITGCLYIYGPQSELTGVSLIWSSIALIVLAFISTLMAYRRMTADQKLLNDSGRIR